MRLTISTGNMKLGNIPNLSLPPIKTCAKGILCAKKCYAMKSYRMYPNVRKAWDGNLKLWDRNPEKFDEDLQGWLFKHNPAYFRWHVGGDIPDAAYAAMIRRTALYHLMTRFLVYTKKDYYAPLLRGLPNLNVFVSRWPGDKVTVPQGANGAWLYDEKNLDLRMPCNVFMCPGSCKTCKSCYLTKWDVAFKIH